ncbi:MAG: Ig-like domain-containing protein [Anoxybacillus sp.]|nr:Ig-like domain-containing protein [Anoxybacillus sp.]MCL6586219.1 Ig-like domain-containing protein [Anoxybacillus sp.]
MKRIMISLLSFLFFFSPLFQSYALGEGETVSEPSIEVRGIVDGGKYNTGVTPEIICQGTCEAYLNGRTFESGTTLSDEGTYRLVVKATVRPYTITKYFNFEIDKSAPSFATNIDDTEEKRKTKPSIYVYPTNESATLYYSINGVLKTIWLDKWERFYFDNELGDNGTYTISFYLEDSLGNRTETKQKTITIDNTPPVITVIGVEDGGVYRSATPIIMVNEGTYEASISTSYDSYYKEFISGTSLTREGSYRLYVTAKDEAGNSSKTTIDFNIDTTAPTIQTYGYRGVYIENTSTFPVTSPIKLKFDEPLNLSTLNTNTIQLRNVETGQYESEKLDFANAKQEKANDYWNKVTFVTIPLKEKLRSLSKYRLIINTAGITDALGNAMEPKTITQDFQTRQFYDAVSIVSSNVDGGEMGSLGSIKLQVDQDITLKNITGTKFRLKNVSTGELVYGNIDVNGREISLQPNAGLAENTTYELTIEPDGILSNDGIPMKAPYSKTFKVASLFKAVSGPEEKITERRPQLSVTFNNPIDEKYVDSTYFKLLENDLSNRNEEVETKITLSPDKKTVSIFPLANFSSGDRYKVIVSSGIRDIYGQQLAVSEDVSYPIEVGNIVTLLQKPTDITWTQVNFKTIRLSWKDTSIGETGYYLRVDGDKENQDYYPSVKGYGSVVTFDLVFDEPLGVHTVEIMPADEEGDEAEDYKAKVTKIKLTANKPAKPSNVRVKLLRDGSLEWTWKDVPADYPGETAYVIIRKKYAEKASSANRTHSSKGRFVERIDLSKETVVNNTIVRYISRSINIEGAGGSDFESDKVKYVIKLPAKPPKATIKRSEYDQGSRQFTIQWTMKDSKNVARTYAYIFKRNGEIVATTDKFTLKPGQTSVSDTLDYYNLRYYYYDMNEEDKWQIVVVTYNAVGIETNSSAKDIIFISEE